MFSRLFQASKRSFSSLSEKEILALAISSEEDDGRIYLAYAQMLAKEYPDSAKIFTDMADEESEHRSRLIELFQSRFGEDIPLIRREHVQGYYQRKPDWLKHTLSVDKMRAQAELMEEQAHRFYLAAAKITEDANTRKLLGDLAIEEAAHSSLARELEDKYLNEEASLTEEKKQKKQFILTYVQPGLAGLMDGSVSTLAPIFAAAFATGDTWSTFLVGLAASIGAGISMGFTEVASDDGVISGRGSPIKRGLTTGSMTTLGGLGHALPYLINDFWTATTIAIIVVFIELWVIAWIQKKYMETPWSRALLQVVVGGALVFAAGMIIGNF